MSETSATYHAGDVVTRVDAPSAMPGWVRAERERVWRELAGDGEGGVG